MAPFAGDQMAYKSKHRRERKMQPNETPVEASEPTADLDAEIDKAMENVDVQAVAENQTSSREAAALEERLNAERIAQARNESDEAGEEMERTTLIGAAAKGRESLLAKLRDHSQKPKEVYIPPPMTERQLSRREEEMEAGRRAVAKQQAQITHRPVPPHDSREGGPSTPIHRPGNLVPDPGLMTNGSSPAFVAGTKVFSPKA
jgi:hypothetical protein